MNSNTDQIQRIQQRKMEGFTVQLKSAGYDDATVAKALPVYADLDAKRTKRAAGIRDAILGIQSK